LIWVNASRSAVLHQTGLRSAAGGEPDAAGL
jgi:hypothetical protein